MLLNSFKPLFCNVFTYNMDKIILPNIKEYVTVLQRDAPEICGAFYRLSDHCFGFTARNVPFFYCSRCDVLDLTVQVRKIDIVVDCSTTMSPHKWCLFQFFGLGVVLVFLLVSSFGCCFSSKSLFQTNEENRKHWNKQKDKSNLVAVAGKMIAKSHRPADESATGSSTNTVKCATQIRNGDCLPSKLLSLKCATSITFTLKVNLLHFFKFNYQWTSS